TREVADRHRARRARRAVLNPCIGGLFDNGNKITRGERRTYRRRQRHRLVGLSDRFAGRERHGVGGGPRRWGHGYYRRQTAAQGQGRDARSHPRATADQDPACHTKEPDATSDEPVEQQHAISFVSNARARSRQAMRAAGRPNAPGRRASMRFSVLLAPPAANVPRLPPSPARAYVSCSFTTHYERDGCLWRNWSKNLQTATAMPNPGRETRARREESGPRLWYCDVGAVRSS